MVDRVRSHHTCWLEREDTPLTRTKHHRFPHYKPDNNVFSIWAESYGGHYGPTFADYFEQQNSQISSGALDADTTIPLHLDTLGIVNGCLDMAVQMPFYPEMAYNNTWGIQAINETAYAAATAAWPRCRELIDECRTLAASLDPLSTGASETVNDACAGAYEFCFDSMWQPYISSGVSRQVAIPPRMGDFVN